MDKYTQLEKLQTLKEKGAITETEFEQEKQKILAQSPSHQPQLKASPQSTTTKKANGAGIAGFVIALVGGFNWYISLPFGIIGLIFSIVGMSKPKEQYKRGLAIAGLVVSIILILVGIAFYFRLMTFKDSTGTINRYD